MDYYRLRVVKHPKMKPFIGGDSIERIELMEREILVSHEQVRHTVDNILDMIMKIEIDGDTPKYISVNPKFYEVLIAHAKSEYIRFPKDLFGLEVIVNPNQIQNVQILLDAEKEYMKSW